MSVLVFLEHHGSELQKGALGVLTKAAALGDADVGAVLVGEGVTSLAAEAGTLRRDERLRRRRRVLRPAAAAVARGRAREGRSRSRLRDGHVRELRARRRRRLRARGPPRRGAELGSRRPRQRERHAGRQAARAAGLRLRRRGLALDAPHRALPGRLVRRRPDRRRRAAGRGRRGRARGALDAARRSSTSSSRSRPGLRSRTQT